MNTDYNIDGKLFVHFKGNVYKVDSSKVINETGGFNVVYHRIYPEDPVNQQYTQPLSRFLEVVYRDDEKYLRFYPITEEELEQIKEFGDYPCLIYGEKE